MGIKVDGAEKENDTEPPVYWPSALPWPLVRNGTVLSIVAELETFPPIFHMSDLSKVRGEIPKWEHTDPSKKRRPRGKGSCYV